MTFPTDDNGGETVERQSSTPLRFKDYPVTKSADHLFSEQAIRVPNAIAVQTANSTLTYAELDSLSNQLANYLINRGVVAGALVGICLDRSTNLLVGLLGILKAGAAYVPMDPMFPRDRLRFMAADAGIQYILTETETADIIDFDSVTPLLVLSLIHI